MGGQEKGLSGDETVQVPKHEGHRIRELLSVGRGRRRWSEEGAAGVCTQASCEDSQVTGIWNWCAK